jgi:soluble lytic murein transglycosylase-like protein
MAIDPTAAGTPSALHVPLSEAGRHARNLRGAAFSVPETRAVSPAGTTTLPGRTTPPAPGAPPGTAASEPHTPIASRDTNANIDRWDALLNRLGKKYNVPPLFLKAVMMIESSGRPDAIGDNGHSVGLFQLHDRGYGYGMGDLRFDPEINADRAAQGLAASWHKVQQAGYTGEFAVRAAYDDTFNPGGGFAHQGDALVRAFNQLLERQGLPPLS